MPPTDPRSSDASLVASQDGATEVNDGSHLAPGRPPRLPLRRRAVDALISIGPFAGALTAYGLLLDNLQDSWFTYIALKYIFAGVGALCVGFALRFFAQRFTSLPESRSDALSPPARVALPAGNINSPSFSPYSIFVNTAAALLADIRSGQHDGDTIYGWSQYIGDDVPPTAMGTSYGLRTAMALDLRSSVINYGRLVRSLLALQKPGGGWAASTQRGAGRPEVTAWVLGAAARAGIDEQVLASLVQLLERLAGADDPVALNRTTVVATIVTTLADVAPTSVRLQELSARLAQGASAIDTDNTPVSWGESLQGGPKGSIPHTARAVVALKKAARVVPRGAYLESAANAGISWLVAENRSLADTDEQLRRHVGGGEVDALFVGHFTAAWTARAIMTGEDPSTYLLALKRAMRAVLESEQHGVWRWHDDSKPMWMTYQGINAVREYILRGFEWPP